MTNQTNHVLTLAIMALLGILTVTWANAETKRLEFVETYRKTGDAAEPKSSVDSVRVFLEFEETQRASDSGFEFTMELFNSGEDTYSSTKLAGAVFIYIYDPESGLSQGSRQLRPGACCPDAIEYSAGARPVQVVCNGNAVDADTFRQGKTVIQSGQRCRIRYQASSLHSRTYIGQRSGSHPKLPDREIFPGRYGLAVNIILKSEDGQVERHLDSLPRLQRVTFEVVGSVKSAGN